MQNNSFNSKLTFIQKLKNYDFILLTCILLLSIISSLSMYSTDGGEVLFHSKSHMSKFVIFFTMMIFLSFLNIKFIQEAMFASTNEVRGTSYSSRIKDQKYQFAGKTGTSQVKRITEKDRELDLKTSEIPYNDRDHALFIAFGPYEKPGYALSIVIEHGGSGSATAAPIAKKLFKLIVDRHELREKIRIKRYLKT